MAMAMVMAMTMTMMKGEGNGDCGNDGVESDDDSNGGGDDDDIIDGDGEEGNSKYDNDHAVQFKSITPTNKFRIDEKH